MNTSPARLSIARPLTTVVATLLTGLVTVALAAVFVVPASAATPTPDPEKIDTPQPADVVDFLPYDVAKDPKPDPKTGAFPLADVLGQQMVVDLSPQAAAKVKALDAEGLDALLDFPRPAPGDFKDPKDPKDPAYAIPLTYMQPVVMSPIVNPPTPATAGPRQRVVCDVPAAAIPDVNLGIGTNVPSDLTVTYWPTDNPAARATVTFPGTARDLELWAAGVPVPGEYDPATHVFQHCGTLTGLTANTDYTGMVQGSNPAGMAADPVGFEFNSSGRFIKPVMFAVPLNDSLLYVSVPFSTTESAPMLFAQVPDVAGDPSELTCDTPFSYGSNAVQAQRQRTSDIALSWLEYHHYDRSFTQRRTAVYDISSGTDVVICAVFLDGARITRVQEIVVGSPDIPEPTLVLTRLTAGEAGLDSNAVNLRVTTHSGWSCGGTPVTLPYGGLTPGVSLTDDGEPIRLCDAAYSAHHTFANIGSGSGLVVVASVVHEGETYTSRSIVSTDFARCDSSCLADRNRRNTSISLPQLPGVDTCDGPFNEVCRNPIIPRSAGSLGLRIQWNDTEGNGRDHWLVGITTNHVS